MIEVIETDQEVAINIRDEESFTKFFKKNAFSIGFGKGNWEQDGKRGWKLILGDGSYIRIKFFDTIKRIFNSRNVEIPGRESYLNYIDVVVMPIGVKGYMFTMDVSQHTMAFSKGKASAKVLHQQAVEKLSAKAAELGIDLSLEGSWETYYDRSL